MLARSALITRWSSNQVPWDPWLCIMLARRLPTFTQCLPTSASCWPGVCRRSPNVCRRLHHAGPVGVDHSMELQPGPLGSIEGTASSPGPQLQPVPAPMESIEETASSPGPWITRWNSNQVPWDPWLCILPAHGSMVVHRVPARRLPTFTQCLPTSAYVQPMFADVCILPARSALITRWNSNQVPWDPSRELHRVPARRGLHHAGPVGVDHSMELQPGPLDPSRELHRVPAHGSKVVHHAGPWIHGCASCWPMDPWLCILPALGSMVVHHAGPVGADHSMELQPGPLGSIEGTASSPGPQLQPCPDPMESIEGTASSPGPWIQGCASCWPGRR